MKLSDVYIIRDGINKILYKDKLVVFIDFINNKEKKIYLCRSFDIDEIITELIEINNCDKIINIEYSKKPEKFFTVCNVKDYFNQNIHKFI